MTSPSQFSPDHPVPTAQRIFGARDLFSLWFSLGIGLMVLQTGAPSEGLRRDWPEPTTGVDTHYGYAFQWFGLSVLVVLLYVWFQLVRRFYLPRRAGEASLRP